MPTEDVEETRRQTHGRNGYTHQQHDEGSHHDYTSERTPTLPRQSSHPSYGSVGGEGVVEVEEEVEGEDKDSTNTATQTYLARFWILFISSFICWFHTVLWNTWGPISESIEAAFTGWQASTVAMMLNCGTIMFVVWMFPMAWATRRCGLRMAMITCASLMAVSTIIRIITRATPVFTIMCYLSALLLGVASTIALAGPVLIASDWFPLQERTTAMAVMFGSSQLGSLGSYLEPLVIRLPSPHISKELIQEDVMRLLYAEAGVSCVLLVAVLVYFPSRPPTPPSISSTNDRFHIISGIKHLATNQEFMILVASYGVFVGPPMVWICILNYSLIPLGFHQDSTMYVGLVSVVASSVAPVFSGRINDLYKGHIKLLLVLLMLATTACFYWFLLITYGILTFSTWQVYVSVVGAVAFNFAAIPLYFEVGMDLAYPVPEILVSGIITAADNLTSVLFLLAFYIPNVGYQWMTYTLAFTSSLPILLLFFITFDNKRANIDA